MTITAKYSCAQCGLRRVECAVPARGAEGVLEWMNHRAIPALMADHEARSPGCRPKEFTEVLIPMTNTSKVGGPVEH